MICEAVIPGEGPQSACIWFVQSNAKSSSMSSVEFVALMHIDEGSGDVNAGQQSSPKQANLQLRGRMMWPGF